MKLMTLNTWGGRVGIDSLKDFLRRHSDIDIFCFQEIWQTEDPSLVEVSDSRIVLNLLQEIASVLTDYDYYFRPQYRGIYGLATFVRKNIRVAEEGELFVFKHQGYENSASIGNHGRNIQYLKLDLAGGALTVVNFHGLWNGQGKGDSEDRILQSTIIADFLATLTTPYVLAGDFNLTPETQSFAILKEACPKDLIAEYGATSTRSSFYTKSIRLADYIMTCNQVTSTEFAVLPDEVSDHLALRVHLRI